jgi:hypothetical protein
MKIWILIGAMAVAGCSSSSESSEPAPAPTGTAAQADSLYDRLGKHDGIAKAVDAIVAEELKDPEIASYFYFQVQSPITAGHPSADQIKECLVAQLGNAAGGPEQYPLTASGGFQCRGMTAAHAKLGIPDGVFTKFLTIAAGVLKSAGVSDADIKTVGGVLDSTRTQVAQDKTRQTGSFMPPQGM